MLFLDRTLPTLAENLALDEALLRAADEQQSLDNEVLRVWQAPETAVIVGRSSKVSVEVFTDEAAAKHISIMRRPSGGATVVIGAGCLLYSLLIDMNARPALRMLDAMHQFVMDRMVAAMHRFNASVRYDGTCDLVIDDRKFSGNSLKVGRNWTLYHGTILLGMDLSLINQLLRHPPREPEYRRGRLHSDFVTNLPVSPELLTHALREVWQADQPLQDLPLEIMHQLVVEKYSQASWNFQRS